MTFLKKLLTLVLALMLMMTMTVPAFAAISPEAGVITTTTGGAGNDGGMNDSPTSPSTGNQLWIVVAGGVLAVSLATVCVASKKLANND